MIPARLDDVTEDLLNGLMAAGVFEGMSLEFKSDFPRDQSFVESVCALANTYGGDLVVGVEELQGRATAIPGVEVNNLDQERLRISNLITQNTDPQLRAFSVGVVPLASGRFVFVVRVEQSWHRPHMCRSTFKFPARSLAGKHPMDAANIRQGMLLSVGIAERMSEFVEDRVSRIVSGRTRVALTEGIVLCLHLLPLSAFASETFIEPGEVKKYPDHFGLMRRGGHSWDFNADGILLYPAGRDKVHAFTQVFRRGQVEAVFVFNHKDASARDFVFPWPYYENLVVEETTRFIAGQRLLGIEPPFFASVSVIAPTNSLIPSDLQRIFENHRPQDPIVTSPACQITAEDLDSIRRPLRLAFDVIANAWGQEKSPNYD